MKFLLTVPIILLLATATYAGWKPGQKVNVVKTVKTAGRDLARETHAAPNNVANEVKNAGGVSQAVEQAIQDTQNEFRRGSDELARGWKSEYGRVSDGLQRGTDQVGDRLCQGRDNLRDNLGRSFDPALRGLATADSVRLEQLDKLNATAQHVGIHEGNNLKKNGGLLANEWKRVSGTLPDLEGWLKEHAQDGDILLLGNSYNPDCGEFGHACIITDAKNETVWEAHREHGNDVHSYSWKKMSKAYTKIALYRVKDVTPEQTAKACKWVVSQEGKPFRMPILDGLEKNDSTRMYCSQLVYMAYQEAGIQIHQSKSPLVHPDDLGKSPQLILIQKSRPNSW